MKRFVNIARVFLWTLIGCFPLFLVAGTIGVCLFLVAYPNAFQAQSTDPTTITVDRVPLIPQIPVSQVSPGTFFLTPTGSLYLRCDATRWTSQHGFGGDKHVLWGVYDQPALREDACYAVNVERGTLELMAKDVWARPVKACVSVRVAVEE
jgi:hypothetical protein